MDASWIPRLRSRDQERDDEIMQRALMECRGIMTTPQDAAASLISADGMGKPDSPDGEVSTPIYGQERKMQNPMRMIQLAQEVMGDKAVVVVDGGDFVATAAYILRPKAPLRWLDPGAFGTLGVGGGFALGVSRSMPDAEVWLFYGDGSLGFSLAEFDTFVRYRVPVIAVVGNDASWAQIAREQVPMLQSSVACNLAHSEYEVAARGLGAQGIRIGPDCSEEDARSRFAEAQSLARSGRPVLVNCIIGKSDFREGSISV